MFVRLYKKYARPHLEFTSPAWSQSNILLKEKFQERTLRSVTGLQRTSYSDRCKVAGFQTLESRRGVSDISQTFKILKGIDKVKKNFYDEMRREHRTRQSDNPSNMARREARKDTRLNSCHYSVRVVEKWNNLPDSLKSMEKVDVFKRALCEVNANENKKGGLKIPKRQVQVSESERTRQVECHILPGRSLVRAGQTKRMPDVHIRRTDGTNWTIPQVYLSKYQ